jgi:2-polyprenyl-6-methoxyphenol hydroxylase-like FAD-dependent oxidoreductase
VPGVSLDTKVLIAGAGPVGLLLANECARRGIEFRLVEARESQSQHSKALAIFPRTLEILDMAGLSVPFLASANRVTSVAVMDHDRTLARIAFTPQESCYPFICMIPQDVTERLLLEQLQRRGGSVEYRTSLVSAAENGERVRVTLERGGRSEELDAAFVVGCDGAHSAVRHLLALPFAGGEYRDHFMLADVDTDDALPADQLQLCPSESGPLAIFPMSATRRRIVATLTQPKGDAPSLEFVQSMLDQRAPHAIAARAVRWSSYFHVHHRHVAQLRVGRVLIAGDAAHIHSPFGGQGMNTGLHDVWNLAWKLDLVLKGHCDGRLLDSYGAERLPVIEQVIDTTHRMTRIMGARGKLAQAARGVAIPMASHLASFQHAFVQRLSGLGIAYRGSPIIEGNGERYFDETMRGGGICSRFLLVLGNDADSPAMDAAQQLAASFAQWVEVRRTRRPGVTLVRPDGYVAYSVRHGDGMAALESVRSLLERQAGRSSRTARRTQAPDLRLPEVPSHRSS